MSIGLRVLKVFHFGEVEKENLEVTFSPSLIRMITTSDTVVQDRPVKETTVFFVDDSEPVVLNLNTIDVMELEKVIGAYSFGEEY